MAAGNASVRKTMEDRSGTDLQVQYCLLTGIRTGQNRIQLCGVELNWFSS